MNNVSINLQNHNQKVIEVGKIITALTKQFTHQENKWVFTLTYAIQYVLALRSS